MTKQTNKALYIYSFRTNPDFEATDYDWFVGKDVKDYEDQRKIVAKYMIENEFAEDTAEAMQKLDSVYKQTTSVLLNELQGKK